ncbi:MAG: flagellar hook-basal body complex protein FliE [Armatimonadetes bacterium]|nr:flagellar hook-basal body complex protein FliE [Armatimonadota bacterium]
MQENPLTGVTPLNSKITPITSEPYSAEAERGVMKEGGASSFSGMLMQALNNANDALIDSGKMNAQMAVGKLQNIHTASVAGMKAEVMLKLTTQIVTKVASACSQLFQMQL